LFFFLYFYTHPLGARERKEMSTNKNYLYTITDIAVGTVSCKQNILIILYHSTIIFFFKAWIHIFAGYPLDFIKTRMQVYST